MSPIRSGIRPFALTAFLFGLVSAAGQTEARGDLILYGTGFEPPAFTAGQPVNGQGGWIAAIGQQAGNRLGALGSLKQHQLHDVLPSFGGKITRSDACQPSRFAV